MKLEQWGFFASAILTGLSLAIVFSAYVYLGHTLTAEVYFTTYLLSNQKYLYLFL